MKKKRRIENRIIAVILCMAILFSQVNIADAADLNPSGTNTSQVVLSDETNMSNDEASTESTVSDEINGTMESESKISEETNENSKNNESESSGENVKAESTDNIDAYYKDSKICIYNYEQLKQIGSDAYVYTGDKDGKIGSGDVVKSEGTELKYGADAQYILMSFSCISQHKFVYFLIQTGLLFQEKVLRTDIKILLQILQAILSTASFEKIPRAIPFCIATIIVPAAPPASALPVNALFTIVTTAAGSSVICVTIIISANTKYKTAINGTMISETFAILLRPPITTSPTNTVRQSPATTVAME